MPWCGGAPLFTWYVAFNFAAGCGLIACGITLIALRENLDRVREPSLKEGLIRPWVPVLAGVLLLLAGFILVLQSVAFACTVCCVFPPALRHDLEMMAFGFTLGEPAVLSPDRKESSSGGEEEEEEKEKEEEESWSWEPTRRERTKTRPTTTTKKKKGSSRPKSIVVRASKAVSSRRRLLRPQQRPRQPGDDAPATTASHVGEEDASAYDRGETATGPMPPPPPPSPSRVKTRAPSFHTAAASAASPSSCPTHQTADAEVASRRPDAPTFPARTLAGGQKEGRLRKVAHFQGK